MAQGCLTPFNWRRLCLGAIVLAAKVSEDLAVWNVDFVPAFPLLTVQDINNIERVFLTCIDFRVTISSALYARYYFELRHISINRAQFALEAREVSDEVAVALEKKSSAVENLFLQGEGNPVTPRKALNLVHRTTSTPLPHRPERRPAPEVHTPALGYL
jgi:hypothetical protein